RSGTLTIGEPNYENGLRFMLPVSLTLEGSMLYDTNGQALVFDNDSARPFEGGWRVELYQHKPKDDRATAVWRLFLHRTLASAIIDAKQHGSCTITDDFATATYSAK